MAIVKAFSTERYKPFAGILYELVVPHTFYDSCHILGFVLSPTFVFFFGPFKTP